MPAARQPAIHARPSNRRALHPRAVLLLTLSLLLTAPAVAEPCRILVVDKENGWPVPLIELRTTAEQKFITDNAGVIALNEPELMDKQVWFHIRGHGYEVERDGFGMRGVRVIPQPGKTIRIEVTRTIIAKRLGRLTGAGQFAESQKLGDEKEWKETGVVGTDSVQTAVHRGKHHWLWGDTALYHYPLGVFHMTSATTGLQPLTDFKPPVRVKYNYFRDEHERPRGVAKLPGDGPTWLTGIVSLKDKDDNDRLVGLYNKIKPPLETYETGLCVWDDVGERFDRWLVVWQKTPETPTRPPVPEGHPLRWKDENGSEWILFGDPLPTLKVPASFEAWKDPKRWRKLTPQRDLPVAGSDDQRVRPHSGSVAWNPYRKRFVTVFMQHFGKPSVFGELWYAEADKPTGPWGPAVKILSHDNYTFYNPRIHPEFTPDDSPVLLFEGTYTATFADDPPKTPRYDYNQVLYRLDLDDEKLKPAQAKQ